MAESAMAHAGRASPEPGYYNEGTPGGGGLGPKSDFHRPGDVAAQYREPQVPASSASSVGAAGEGAYRRGDMYVYENAQEATHQTGPGQLRTQPRQPMLLEPLGSETMVADRIRRDEDEILDPPGYIRYNIYGITFELPTTYIPPIEALGRGGYGFVASAQLASTGESVAVKKISNAFRDVLDAKRVLREVVIQRHMEHPNIARIRDVIRPARPSSFEDVYIVYDLMPSDLKQVIDSEQPLIEKHFKYILFQLLRGLKFIHSANVLHRDLKPSNILIDERCNVRITDFGLARTVLGLEDHMTEYVVTRWYRAPELLLSCQKHTGEVDIWSVGCIYMELVTRQVWIRGRDPLDQLRKTMQRVGSPTEDDLGFLESDDARKYLLLQTPYPRRPFTELFPQLSPKGADLAEQMLMFDPAKRITADEALRHPYLAQYYDAMDDITCEVPFELDLSFEQPHFTVPLIRQLIYEVACDFNPPQ